MTNVSAHIVGPTTALQTASSVQNSVAPQTNTTADTGAKSTSPTTTTAAPTFASRLISDPLAGTIVTQYLNVQGQVITQSPSSAVVAYLRDGLTQDGQPRAVFPPEHTTYA